MIKEYKSLAEIEMKTIKETYVKCQYQETGMGDYMVIMNGEPKEPIFLDKEWLAGEIKENAREFCDGLVKVVLQGDYPKNKDNVLVFVNGEGFEVSKKDIVIKVEG